MLSLLIQTRLGQFILVIIVLCVIALVPLIIGGVVFYTLRKNRLSRQAWQKLAREIGFHMPEPKKLRMTGIYNGIETMLSIGMRRSGSGEDRTREYFTYCVSTFPRELRFGLQITSPKGLLDGLFKSKETVVGNKYFDKAFSSVCYDQRVLQRFLLSDFPSQKTGNLMGDLMIAYQKYRIVKLTDKQIYIEISGQERDPAVLKELMAVTNRVAMRFSKARETFPPEEWENHLNANWQSFGRDNGLSYDPSEARLTGNYRGFPVDISLHCEPGRWLTTLEVQYPQRLMVGYSIYPEKSFHKVAKVFGFEDLRTGNPAFDNAYIVKAKNKDVALAKLTPDFCEQMVGLDRHTHNILLDDEKMKMTLTQVLGETDTLKSYLAAMISAMSKLA
jgi:hypothetical protein